LSLYGVASSEESGYIDSLTYLSERNKVGVVKLDGSPLKDVYLIALLGLKYYFFSTKYTNEKYVSFFVNFFLLENEKPPDWMNPMDGAGLPDDHPAIILALIIKKSEKLKRSSESKESKKM